MILLTWRSRFSPPAAPWKASTSRALAPLLVFEDLHWIDSETQAMLDMLVESLPTTRVLLLVNYRPESLYARLGQWEQARPVLGAALDLYRAMAMTFWLPQVEATLAQRG